MRFLRLTTLLLALTVFVGCSTTRTLADDELRLAENRVVVANSTTYNPSGLTPYLKQKSNYYFIGKWHPGLYIYNWQNGKDKGWDRFCRKIGQAPVVFDSSQVDKSIASMRDHLSYQGYYDSSIDAFTRVKNRTARVEYDVTLGKRFPIRSIRYEAPDTTLAALLTADSLNFTVRTGDFLSEEALEAESERLAGHFRNNGYWGFSKNYFFFYADTSTHRDQADLIVRLENYTRNESADAAREHRPYTIGDVTLMPQPGMRIRSRFLQNLNQLKTGELYSEEKINRAYARYASIPLFSSVNMQLRESQTDSTAVDCRILLQQARLQALKLNLEGSFNSTGLFGVTPSLSYSHKNIFGGGEVLSLGFRGNFQFMFDASTRATELAVNSGLKIPWYPDFILRMPFVNLPQMDVNFAYSYQQRPEYTRNIATGAYGFSWNIANKFYYQFNPVQLSAVSATRLDAAFLAGISDPYLKNSFRSHLDLGGGGTFYYTTNTSVNPQVSYFYTRFQYDMSGNLMRLLGTTGVFRKGESGDELIAGIPYSQYIRGELQAVGTFRLGDMNQYALAVRGLAGMGYAYGNSVSLPFEKLFYAGGASSMRGWQARALGPGGEAPNSTFVIPSQTGDLKLEANIEYRFNIVRFKNGTMGIEGALFSDTGNVWDLTGIEDEGNFRFSDFYKSIASDWGLGIRLNLQFILIRVDFGMQVYDPTLAEGSRFVNPARWLHGANAWHFGVGYPF